MFIELHMIQNFAPSNLNRDDTNNPKDCEFGGHRRGRISSQSLKRAIRYEPVFEKLTGMEPSDRTRWMARSIRDRLVKKGKVEKEATAVATAFVSDYAGQMDKKKPEKTSVLLYLSESEFQLITHTLINNWDNALETATKGKTLADLVKQIVDATKQYPSAPDIAMFGRMLAGKTELNVDAACQVAHAISTHRINMEMDFFTAVDDLPQPDEDEGAGAGMMGFTSFNSACFYRYARIDWNQLVKNLNGNIPLARRTVEGFLRAAIDAIPTGKQNNFAAQNPTNLAMVVVRKDGKCWNLVNAFEKPVRTGQNNGLIDPSIRALDHYWDELNRSRDDAEIQLVAVYADTGERKSALQALVSAYQPTLSGWINQVNQALPQE